MYADVRFCPNKSETKTYFTPMYVFVPTKTYIGVHRHNCAIPTMRAIRKTPSEGPVVPYHP